MTLHDGFRGLDGSMDSLTTWCVVIVSNSAIVTGPGGCYLDAVKCQAQLPDAITGVFRQVQIVFRKYTESGYIN